MMLSNITFKVKLMTSYLVENLNEVDMFEVVRAWTVWLFHNKSITKPKINLVKQVGIFEGG